MQNLTQYFDFPPPHCLLILLGCSEEDSRVFTGDTAKAKAKSSEKFRSPDQNWPNFGTFRELGSGSTINFDFCSKRHILVRIRRIPEKKNQKVTEPPIGMIYRR